MKRDVYIAKLEEWKRSSRRKPLILEGACQVGKTWLMKEFAKTHYENVVYARFDKNRLLRTIFKRGFDVERIIRDLQTLFNTRIDPSNTVLLLDEIQACKDAITALKYFQEDRPDLHVIAAGSLLGLTYRDDDDDESEDETTGFPVGKVNTLKVYPFSFSEFLVALGEDRLAESIRRRDWSTIELFGEKLADILRHYYVVGGMPEAVETYVNARNFKDVREVHREILNGYLRDISKHAPKRDIPKIELCWRSVPVQLAKENKKFVYANLKKGGRSAEFSEPLAWLEDAGLIGKVKRVTVPRLPLDGYADGAFKVFMLDVGLLSTMSGLAPEVVLDGPKIFSEFKGALTEQYVFQQLRAETEIEPFYWSTEDSRNEVDFVFQKAMSVCPLEVKAEENARSQSLKSYERKFRPGRVFRASMRPYVEQDVLAEGAPACKLVNVPLVAVGQVERMGT